MKHLGLDVGLLIGKPKFTEKNHKPKELCVANRHRREHFENTLSKWIGSVGFNCGTGRDSGTDIGTSHRNILRNKWFPNETQNTETADYR